MATSSDSQYVAALAQKYYAAAQKSKPTSAPQTSAQPKVVYTGLSNLPVSTASSKAPAGKNPTGVHKLIDLLMQPQYALVQTGEEIAAAFKKRQDTNGLAGQIAGSVATPLDVAGKLLSNFGSHNQKKTWSDYMRGDPALVNEYRDLSGTTKNLGHETQDTGFLAANKNDNFAMKLGKGALGLTADIAGDPTTYIGTGAATQLGKAGFELLSKAPVIGGTVAKVGESAAKVAEATKLAAKETRLGQDLTAINAKAKALLTPKAVPAADAAKAVDEAAAQHATESAAAGAVPIPTPPPAPAHLAEAADLNLQTALKDAKTGKLVPPESLTPRQRTAKITTTAPYSPEDQALFAQRLLKQEPLPAPAVADTTKVVEAAKSPLKIVPMASKEEWIASSGDHMVNGTPLRQLDLLTKDKTEAVRFIESQGQKATPQAITRVRTDAARQVDEQYKIATSAWQKDIITARAGGAQATMLPQDKWLEAISTTDSHLGHMAKNLIDNTTGTISQSSKILSPQEIDKLTARMQKEYASQSARFAERAVSTPALAPTGLGGLPGAVGPETAVEAAAAHAASEAGASEAVATARAAQAARSANESVGRLSGPALDAWAKNVASRGVNAKDMAALALAKTPEELQTVISGMRRTVSVTPRWSEVMAKITEADGLVEIPFGASAHDAALLEGSIFNQAQKEVPTVHEIMDTLIQPSEAQIAPIRAGQYLSREQAGTIERLNYEQGIGGKPEGFKYTTRQGTMRNSKVVGQGQGRNRAINAEAQERIFKDFSDTFDWKGTREALATANPKAAGSRIQFLANSKALDAFKEYVQGIEDYYVSRGIHLIANRGSSGVPLSLSQMIKAAEVIPEGRQFLVGRIMDLYGFPVRNAGTRGEFLLADTRRATNLPGQMAISSFLQMGGVIAQFASKDAKFMKYISAEADLTKAAQRLAKMIDSGGASDVLSQAALGINKSVAGVTSRGITTGAKREAVSSEQELRVVQEALAVMTNPEVMKSIIYSVRENAAKANMIFAADVKSVTDNVVQDVVTKLSDVTGEYNFADRVEALANTDTLIRNEATKVDTLAQQELKHAAGIETKAALSEAVPEIDVANAKYVASATKDAEKAVDSTQAAENAAGAAIHKKNVESALKETPITSGDEIPDIAMQTAVGKMLDSLMTRFVAHYGNATIHEATVIGHTVAGLMGRAYRRELTGVDKLTKDIAAAKQLGEGGNKVIAKEAWDAVVKGMYDHPEPQMKALIGQMRNVMDYMFATERKLSSGGKQVESVLSVYQRNGFALDHINEKLAQSRFGLPENVRILSKKTAKKRDGSLYQKAMTKQEVSDQWKNWDIKDPIDFLARMDRVITELSTETAISREGWRIASEHGLASPKPRPGFVPVSRSSLGKESIVRYFPVNKEGVAYIHKDVLPEIKRMDSLINASNHRGSEFNHFVRQNVDPIMAMWKAGMTVWRPGHHVRNIVGDVTMSFLVSGVKNPIYYARALRAVAHKQGELGRTFRGNYGTWDAMAALQGLARDGKQSKAVLEEAAKGITAPIAKTKIAGVDINIDARTLYQKLMDRGALPDFRTQEDIIDLGGDATNIARKIAQRTGWEGSVGQKGVHAAHEKLAGFTEGRDDFVRIGHALHLIENGVDGKKTWTSVDEMFDAVAARIRKTHPDGSDLTPFEKSTMRLVFPFYSWTRKAIPLVVENTLTHPGRAAVYPKFMYNFAKMNGVDLQSMTDPFPEDQLFPSFLLDKMTGPVAQIGGKYWSADFGASNADISNDFLGNGSGKDIMRGIANMLNPAIKMPAELMTGSQVSGVPITNTNDYIDNSIPGVNSINSIFGISPTSGVTNLAQGKLGFDQSNQAAKGNRGGPTENPEYALNYLFGARLLNASKPNYITLARMQALGKAKP